MSSKSCSFPTRLSDPGPEDHHRERAREIQRLEKLLEDAFIKLSSVASNINGVSGRLMLQALIDGQDDPAALAQMAKRKLRQKIPELTEALNGRFKDHHRYLAALFLRRIDAHTADINDLRSRIEAAIDPFARPGSSNTYFSAKHRRILADGDP